MTMSTYSSYTPEDFSNDNDIFGKSALTLLIALHFVSLGKTF